MAFTGYEAGEGVLEEQADGGVPVLGGVQVGAVDVRGRVDPPEGAVFGPVVRPVRAGRRRRVHYRVKGRGGAGADVGVVAGPGGLPGGVWGAARVGGRADRAADHDPVRPVFRDT